MTAHTSRHLKQPKRESFEVTNIFTDFKRHDLGPAFTSAITTDRSGANS
jgi:hypothetical protein